MNKEVIEKMTQIIRCYYFHGNEDIPKSTKAAHKLLSLKWTCEKCKGEGGWKGTEGEPDTMCEDCNGTGEGKPMLGIIKRVQEVPEPVSTSFEMDNDITVIGTKANLKLPQNLYNAYKQGQQDALSAGFVQIEEVT